MPRLTISLDSHNQPYTVSEMRRRLAQVLAKLDGGQPVSFRFFADLTEYPVPGVTEVFAKYNLSVPRINPSIVYGELARPEND